MAVKFKWMGDRFIKDYERKEIRYLHALGHVMTDQMAEFAHKVTGTLRNSMTYKLSNGQGSDFSTDHGEGRPPQSAKVSSPSGKKKVRAGSA